MAMRNSGAIARTAMVFSSRCVNNVPLRAPAGTTVWAKTRTPVKFKSNVAAPAPAMKDDEDASATFTSTKGRFAYTFEIMVSKLLPGGAGWQASSIVADNLGYSATSAEFAAITGAGDMTGVFLGHSVYKAGQSLFNKDISLGNEIGVATWLGTSAFFAGGAWQPAVNLLHDTMGLGFTATLAGTAAACGSMFFFGLRLGRAAMPWIPSGDTKNMAQDAGLSVSIGAATGVFVATDPTFVGAQADMLYQFAAPVFNITDATPDAVGIVTAGCSTLTGFGLVNLTQAAVLPAGACWMDNNNPYAA